MRNISAKVRVVRVAARQWNLVTVAQLVALRIGRATISRWLADGFLSQVHPRVYAVGHSRGGGMANLLACQLAERFAAIGAGRKTVAMAGERHDSIPRHADPVRLVG